MKFSVPTIAMLASSASIASATQQHTKIVKRYIASSASANANGNRRLSGKSGKAANPTGLVSYTVCAQSAVLQYESNLEVASGVIPFLFLPEKLHIVPLGVGTGAVLAGDLNCDAFGISENATCNDSGYAKIGFSFAKTSAYAEATGGNPLQFSTMGGTFLDNDGSVPEGEVTTTAEEGLVTLTSLTCATPAVTKFDTKEGLHPVNICHLELGFHKGKADLIFGADATLALYDFSDNVECGSPDVINFVLAPVA